MKQPFRLTGAVLMQLLVTCSATIIFFILGNFMGWPSPTLPRLEKDGAVPHLTDDEGSWVVSCVPIGASVIPMLAYYVVNIVGRKVLLLGTSVPFFVAWLLIIFAKSAWMLYIAMVLAGVGMGTCFSVGPMYMGEIAEDHIRGAMATFFQVMMNVGVLFSFSIGPYVSTTTIGIICVVFPVLFVASFIWMPESPYFYLMRKNRGDAEKSLMRLRATKDPSLVQEELDNMEQFVEETSKESPGFKELFTDRGNRKGLVIMLGLVLAQNLCGNNALLSYSTQIFEKSNSDLSAEVSVIIMGCVQVILSLVCSFTVDIAGRRPMLVLSTVGCAVALAIEGLFFFLKTEQGMDMEGYDWVPVLAYVLFLIVYTLGLGPLPLAMVGELFPTRIKSLAAAFIVTILSIVGIIVPKIYQIVDSKYGAHAIFWGFSACCILGTVFVALVVPETKGKSLREINQEMNTST